MPSLLSSVGHHFIVGLDGFKLSAEEKRAIKELRPAGIIIFKQNVYQLSNNWISDLKDLMRSAQDAADRENFICSIDHEGGKVHRLPAPITHFPEAQKWATNAAEIGHTMGTELKSLGFNLNYAPVVDVFNEPQNSVIGTRAFSCNAEEIAKPAVEFLNAMQQQGVLGCAKHFPGHGRTIADSHFELPVLTCSKDELASCELLPYQSLINAKLELIMTAHVLYPALDKDKPATYSRSIINSLLREELAYKRAVITDALEMGAIAPENLNQIVIDVINAGGDLLLLGQLKDAFPVVKALGLARSLFSRLEGDDAFQSREKSSTLRIQHLLKLCAKPA